MQIQTSIHVAGTRYEIDRGLVCGDALYQLSGLIFGQQYLLLELPQERDVPVAPHDYVVISGRERFSVASGPYPDDDNPCLRVPLTPVMNDGPVPSTGALTRAKQTAGELSALDPNFEVGDGVFIDLQDLPDAQLADGWRLVVQADDHFYTSPCGNVGFQERLAQDLESARRLYGHVDVFEELTRSLLVFRDQPLGAQWSRRTTDILVQVPQGYPLAALDMFWVPPGLRLADGRMPNCGDHLEEFMGTQWQRISWHYPSTKTWNPATDGLISHMRFVRARLAQNA